jgi:hypothetical protein
MKIGTDIEVFVLENNSPKNPCGIVKGEKEEPFQWDTEGYMTSLDCVAIEYNTPPVTNKSDFKQSVLHSLKYVQTLLKDNQKLCFSPSLRFPDSELYTIESITFGCTPDYNAWTGKMNKISGGLATDNLRSIGLHTHYDCNEKDVKAMVKLLDFTLGIPALLLEPENERRNIYGKAGAYRPSKFGFEYRHLSGYFQQEQFLDFIWDNSELAFSLFKEGFVAPKEVRTIIDTRNLESAKTMVKEYNLFNHTLYNLDDISSQGWTPKYESGLQRNGA